MFHVMTLVQRPVIYSEFCPQLHSPVKGAKQSESCSKAVVLLCVLTHLCFS